MGECIKFETYHSCENDATIAYKDENGKEYCVLHTPLEIRKKLDLENAFNQIVEEKKKYHKYNFGGCHFGNSLVVRQNQYGPAKLNFKDCIFENDFNAKNMTIGPSAFSGAHFLKAAFFVGSEFEGESEFNEVVFAGEANFSSCTFKSALNFSKVKYQVLDFRNAKFYADCYFSFIKKIEDSKTKVENKFIDFSFSDVIIGLDCKVTFHMSSLINSAFSPRGNGILEFLGSSLQNVSFMNADLSNCIFNRIDLSESFFSGAKLSETRFIDCTFREEKSLTYKRIAIFDEFYDQKKEEFLKKGWFTFFNFFHERAMTISALAETYCSLKNNFESNKDYVTADKFHFSEMEMKRAMLGAKILQRNKTGKWNHLFKFLYYLRVKVFSFYPWYKYASGYGTSYTRAFWCILIALLFFSTSYMFTGLPNIEYEIGNLGNLILVIQDFAGSFFYTIGILIPGIARYFADNVPVSTRWLTVTEFIVMWTLIPLLVLALKRHFKR